MAVTTQYPAFLTQRWEKLPAPQVHAIEGSQVIVSDTLLRQSPTLGIAQAIAGTKQKDLERGKAALNLGVGQLAVAVTPRAEDKELWLTRLDQAAAAEPNNPALQLAETTATDDPSQGENLYGPTAGTPGLRAAYALRFAEDTGTPVTAANIAIGSGGKGAMTGALSRIQPGDTFIVWAPGWPTNYDAFPPGVNIVVADTEGRGIPSPEQVETALQQYPHARGMLINAPSNPTGQNYSKEERDAVAGVIRKHLSETGKTALDFMLMFDEPYGKLTLDGAPDQMLLENERALFQEGYSTYVWSLSKEWGMPGLRVGAVIANDKPIEEERDKLLARLREDMVGGRLESDSEYYRRYSDIERYARGSVAQLAVHNECRSNQTSLQAQNLAQAAILFGMDYVDTVRDYLRDQREVLMKGMLPLKDKVANIRQPQGAMYGWPDFSPLDGKWMPKGTLLVQDENDELGKRNQSEPVRINADNIQRFLRDGLGVFGMEGKDAYGPGAKSFEMRVGISVPKNDLLTALDRFSRCREMLGISREEASRKSAVTPLRFRQEAAVAR